MRIASGVGFAALAVAACLIRPGTASALADLVINVNCAGGSSIGRALDRPTVFDRRLVLVVSGTCNENASIARDDVVVRAAGGGGVAATDATKPAILVDGAKRVALENLVVTGGHEGVRVTAGASATIRNATVRNAVIVGVRVDSGASAQVEDSLLENNGQYGLAASGATATLVRSTVRNNNFSGVVAVSGGALILGQVDDAGNVCCGNTIEGNRLDGVTVARAASARMYGNVVQNNGTTTGRWGVLSVEQSLVWMEGGNVLRGNGGPNGGGGAFVRGSSLRTGPGDTPVIPSGNDISGNYFGILADSASIDLRGGSVVIAGNARAGIDVEQGSMLRVDTISVTGNGAHGIFVNSASGVFLGAATNVSGNGLGGVTCQDAGSHFSGTTAGVVNNPAGNVNCTPF
jgi:Periplasmic copper-binding protein (NosD)